MPHPHQLRVIAERKELSDKFDKLGAFLESAAIDSVDVQERRHLIRQYMIMRDYLEVLQERIQNFA